MQLGHDDDGALYFLLTDEENETLQTSIHGATFAVIEASPEVEAEGETALRAYRVRLVTDTPKPILNRLAQAALGQLFD